MTVAATGAGGGGLAFDSVALKQKVAAADTDTSGQLETSEAIDLGKTMGLDESQAQTLTGLSTKSVDAEVINRFALASASHKPDDAIAAANQAMTAGNPDAAFDDLLLAVTNAQSPAECIKLATAAKELGVPLGEAAIARGCDLTNRATDTVVLALAAQRLGLPLETSREALSRGASQATTVGDSLRVATVCQDMGLPMAANVLDQAVEQSQTVDDCLKVAAAAVAGGHRDQVFAAAHKATTLATTAPELRDLAERLSEWPDAGPGIAGLAQSCLQQALALEATANH